MPKQSVLFLMGGLVAGIVGFGETTGVATGIAQGLFWVLLVSYALSLLSSRRSII